MAPVVEKYIFTPYDCTPGDDWEKFDSDLLIYCTGELDKRGWSVADHLLGIDEGGPSGPALPANNAARAVERRQALAAQRTRAKTAFSILTRHLTDEDWILDLKTNHFQQGHAAYTVLAAACAQPVDALKLRSLNRDWDNVDLLADVGVNANSVSLLAKRLKALNSKRPAAHRKTSDQIAERLLECIMDTSAVTAACFSLSAAARKVVNLRPKLRKSFFWTLCFALTADFGAHFLRMKSLGDFGRFLAKIGKIDLSAKLG